MIKIEPGMEAGTAICLYVIFFFQAAQSIMHYLYFRFWLSTKNCIKILIDISLLFALHEFGLELPTGRWGKL